MYCSDAQDEPSVLVCDDCKLLRPFSLGGLLLAAAAEEDLELLERRLHRDDLVLAALALEPGHGGGERVVGLDFTGVQLLLEMRDGDVAEQSASLGVDDGQMCVVSFKGGEEGDGDGIGRVDGEGGRGVDVFNGGLGSRRVS